MVGVCVTIGGWKLGFGRWQNPGPGFLPMLLGIIISLLSLVWLIMSIARERDIKPSKMFYDYRKVILIILSLIVYTLLLDKAGFMICTFLFLIFLFRAIEPQRWRLVIVLALVVTVVSVFVFQLWLGVQFPEGPFSIYLVKRWIYSIAH